MRTEKTRTPNLRVSAQFTELLRQAVQADHRSRTNLLEKLVQGRCEAVCLVAAGAMVIQPNGVAAHPEV